MILSVTMFDYTLQGLKLASWLIIPLQRVFKPGTDDLGVSEPVHHC